MLEVMPWPVDYYMFKPAWVFLLLLYWLTALPHRINIGSAFILGLIMDLMAGSPLGIRALMLSIITYFISFRYQLFRNLALWQQAVIVVGLSVTKDLLIYWAQFLVGNIGFHTEIFWGALIDGLLWPWLFLLMRKLRCQFAVQ